MLQICMLRGRLWKIDLEELKSSCKRALKYLENFLGFIRKNKQKQGKRERKHENKGKIQM